MQPREPRYTTVHEVWGLPRRLRRGPLVHFATFEEDEWQYALKLRAQLRRLGHRQVRIVKLEVPELDDSPAEPQPDDWPEMPLLPEF